MPNGYKDRDPRSLLFNFPSMPKVKFAKMMNEFYFYKALEAVEEAANKLGFILVPRICMHWKRCRDYSEDRKVKVVGKTYFMMKFREMTENEILKLENYLEENVRNHRLAS
ncbi:hypothetical protein BKP35_18210 [Anaerobacillus arseniciselenatis]|uniref:Uncharacterized protein n=1 Tax=Anaerobacillus arseniciselenatis TaxID=85682 RepID=A0A1S2L560_9BACI|nr:hypothetical protein BKP35_18210 [Anaerobacillus arseniciselenatis]